MKQNLVAAIGIHLLAVSVVWAGPSADGPVDLGPPAVPQEMLTAAPPGAGERLWEPVASWQAKANGALGGLSASEDLIVVQQGLGLEVPGHDPSGEFLARLDDERLLAALALTIEGETLPTSIAAAKGRIAQEALSRKSLSGSHDSLALAAARYRMVSAPSFNEGAAFFSQESDASDIVVTAQALAGPESAAHYEQLYALLDLAELYAAREVSQGVAGVITGSLEGGLGRVAPRAQGGDATALKTAARAALLADRPTLSGEILEEAERSLGKDDAALIEVRYWTGLSYLQAGTQKKAVPVFERNAESTSRGRFVADSVFRLGQAYQMDLDSMNAAVNFMDAAESFPEEKGVRVRAQKALETILKSRPIKHSDVRQAYLARIENNRTSLNKGEK